VERRKAAEISARKKSIIAILSNVAELGAAQPVVLKGHEDSVTAVAFSPDNRWVVTGSDDGTARLWLLQIEDLLVLARRTAGRNLSKDEWQTFLPGQPYFEVFPNLPIPKK
jgi:WD40 repeat protein